MFKKILMTSLLIAAATGLVAQSADARSLAEIKSSGKLLGAHLAGAHATDLIAEATLALQLGASVQDIAHTIHAHPTLAEGVLEAAHMF